MGGKRFEGSISKTDWPEGMVKPTLTNITSTQDAISSIIEFSAKGYTFTEEEIEAGLAYIRKKQESHLLGKGGALTADEQAFWEKYGSL